MKKNDIDRMILWLALIASALAVLGFEMGFNTTVSTDREPPDQCNVLQTIEQRLCKIEQQLNSLRQT